MIIKVRDSILVRPLEPEKTPSTALWLSNIDLVTPNRYSLPAFFYRGPAIPNPRFFDPEILRQALRRALVPFYPIAGRLKLDKDGRTEIDCNAKGVLFVVAECSATIDDLGDFAPSAELQKLVPNVDYAASISSFPLLLLQVTFFKCGGVSIGVGTHHRIVDGRAGLLLCKRWADIVRCQLDQVDDVKPLLDRTVMRARDPPRPQFSHIEYQPSSPTNNATWTEPTNTAMFDITEEQLKILKRQYEKEEVEGNKLTTFEVVAAHAWRCRCMASEVYKDQETRLIIPTDGRHRIQPPLPHRYFGNALFVAMATAKVGDLISKPLPYAASKIKEATNRLDNDYLRSAIDHLELLPPNKSIVERRPEIYRSPNLGITSWVKLPSEESDFGWGPPMYMGPLAVPYEGLSYLVRSPYDNGSLSLAITLETKQIKVFQDMFYATMRKSNM